ncbi:MAG: hypothetical protein M0R39_04850 [Prolixibacteraceae bacterium]|jgi:hypothetical protein|nr:hypothetical protein [Prolixibacteraceae bacterium]
MFTNISWTDYFVAVVLLLAIYYLFVGLRYFSADLKDLFSGKQRPNFSVALPRDKGGEDILSTEENYPNESPAFETTTDDDFAEVEHLIERLKGVIADASDKKLIPQEFKQYLHLVLREYPNIKNSPLRSSINELVASECEKYGAVTLSEDEVDLLWKDAM